MTASMTAPSSSQSLSGISRHRAEETLTTAGCYLYAAAHLRRPMLPVVIDKDGKETPSRPVGRAYARQVLYGAAGTISTPDVSNPILKAHCRTALWQTIIRDGLTVIALTLSAILAPWDTFIVFGLIVLLIAVAGRVRISSPPAIAAGVALALIFGRPHDANHFSTPLIALSACFLVYAADALIACRLIRKALSEETPEVARSSDLDITPGAGLAKWREMNVMSWTNPRRGKGFGISHPPNGKLHKSLGRVRVYYDKHGIVGAGTPFVPLTFTVPVDKPAEEKKPITVFTASQLLAYIAAHIQTQGVAEGSPHGPAHKSAVSDADPPSLQSATDFTYGLPELDVSSVVAIPVPNGRKRLFSETRTFRVTMLPAPEIKHVLSVANRSPSDLGERHYVRAITMSWAGHLVVSVYIGVALQGHYLRVVVRPYIIAPIVTDLKVADDIAFQHPLLQVCSAIHTALREFQSVAKWIREPRSPLTDRKYFRSGLRSMREHYSEDSLDHIYHDEDADRLIRIMEMKAVRVTTKYLRLHNIDSEEQEKQILNFVQNTVIGSGNITSGGTMNMGPVINVSGQQNTTTTSTASG